MNNWNYIIAVIIIVIILVIILRSPNGDSPIDPNSPVDPGQWDYQDDKIHKLCISSKYDYNDESKAQVVDFDSDTDELKISCPYVGPSDIHLKCDYDYKCANKPVPICRTKKENTAGDWDCPKCVPTSSSSNSSELKDTSEYNWVCDESYFLGGYRTAYSFGESYPTLPSTDVEYDYCNRLNPSPSPVKCFAYSINSKYGTTFRDPTGIIYENPNKTTGVRITSDNDNPYYIHYDGRDMSPFLGFNTDNQFAHQGVVSPTECEDICTNVVGYGVGDDRDDHTTPHDVPGCSYYVYDKNAKECIVANQNGGKLSGTRKYISGF